MLSRVKRWVLLCGLLAGIVASAGCSSAGMRGLAWIIAGGDQKVKAEFDGLRGKTVAVVVYSSDRTRYEYPDVNLTVSSAISGLLEKNVKGITIIPPASIVRYQDENIYWAQMDKTELGKAFGADYVLFVPLEEYSTRVPESSYLYQGRITSQVSVYDVSKPPAESRVKKFEKIHVLYPEHEPRGLINQSDRQIRAETESRFAKQVAWKFYDHKEEPPQ